MMNDFNSLTALIVGAYIVKVATAGNSAELIELAKRDKAFVKWFAALVVLLWIRSFPEARKIGDGLIIAALLGFFLTSQENVKSEITTLWSKLS